MTPESWASSRDARELLRFCAERIPRQHLCLVLCEIATAALPHWQSRHPEDWRPAWCVATVRAWCFFQADESELRRALEAVQAIEDPEPSGIAALAAAASTAAAAKAALWRTTTAVADSDYVDPAGFVANAVSVAQVASIAAEFGGDAPDEERLSALADLIRHLVLFPQRSNRRWTS